MFRLCQDAFQIGTARGIELTGTQELFREPEVATRRRKAFSRSHNRFENATCLRASAKPGKSHTAQTTSVVIRPVGIVQGAEKGLDLLESFGRASEEVDQTIGQRKLEMGI